jgi:hypothetical protein
MLCSCASHSQARSSHAPVRTHYFVCFIYIYIYAFYNSCKIFCFTTSFAHVSCCWNLLLCFFFPFCGDLASDTKHVHFRKVSYTLQKWRGRCVLQTTGSNKAATYSHSKLFYLTSCTSLNWKHPIKVTRCSSILIPHNGVNFYVVNKFDQTC